jgi:hypothetical protein
MRALFATLLLACGQDPAAVEQPAAPASVPASVPMPVPALRWIAGDLHMHIAPFDAREGAALTVADLADRGRDAGLEFVVLTPHLLRHTWTDRERRRDWQARWREVAADARAASVRPGARITLIPGAEYTVWHWGHFGISGVDLAALDGGDFLPAVSGAGGLVIVNHPFALPTEIPGIPISDYDLSFRPWTDREEFPDEPDLGGVEVWNLPLGLANLVSRPGGQTGEQRAFAAADALARRTRRRVAAVGGSDNHRRHLVATTWVLAADATEPTLLAALRRGATCVGGPEAGTLRAHGDADPPDRWARIGDSVRAAARVDLKWTGRARLFIDGADAGEHDGGYTHAASADPHTYRIEAGASRCGFLYANLD